MDILGPDKGFWLLVWMKSSIAMTGHEFQAFVLTVSMDSVESVENPNDINS